MCRGPSFGDSFIQGTWSKVALREGINWKELWVLKEALSNRRPAADRKLVLVRMATATAVAFAKHGASRSSRLTLLACEMNGRSANLTDFQVSRRVNRQLGREVASECAVAAPRRQYERKPGGDGGFYRGHPEGSRDCDKTARGIRGEPRGATELQVPAQERTVEGRRDENRDE